MIQNYNRYKILTLFFDSPTKHFQLREISRMTKMGLPSVRNHVKALEGENFVKKEKKTVYQSYRATQNDIFRLYKKNDILLRLHKSGLIEFIINKFTPDVIVLFGSASRGEDIEDSDIDLFVLAKEKPVNIKSYGKILKRGVNIVFESSIKKVPEELLNNIINGVVLYGYLKVLQ